MRRRRRRLRVRAGSAASHEVGLCIGAMEVRVEVTRWC